MINWLKSKQFVLISFLLIVLAQLSHTARVAYNIHSPDESSNWKWVISYAIAIAIETLVLNVIVHGNKYLGYFLAFLTFATNLFYYKHLYGSVDWYAGIFFSLLMALGIALYSHLICEMDKPVIVEEEEKEEEKMVFNNLGSITLQHISFSEPIKEEPKESDNYHELLYLLQLQNQEPDYPPIDCLILPVTEPKQEEKPKQEK